MKCQTRHYDPVCTNCKWWSWLSQNKGECKAPRFLHLGQQFVTAADWSCPEFTLRRAEPLVHVPPWASSLVCSWSVSGEVL